MKIVNQTIFLIAALLLLIGVYLSKKTILLELQGERISAKVDSVIVAGGAYDEGISYYYHYVLIQGNSEDIEGRTYVGDNKKCYKLNDRINVIYLKSDPTINSPDTFKELFLIPSGIFVIAILFLSGGLIFKNLIGKRS